MKCTTSSGKMMQKYYILVGVGVGSAPDPSPQPCSDVVELDLGLIVRDFHQAIPPKHSLPDPAPSPGVGEGHPQPFHPPPIYPLVWKMD